MHTNRERLTNISSRDFNAESIIWILFAFQGGISKWFHSEMPICTSFSNGNDYTKTRKKNNVEDHSFNFKIVLTIEQCL